MNIKSFLVYIFFTFLFYSNSFALDLNSSLDDFFDDLNFNTTYTESGVYEGQRRGYATMGGFSARSRQRNTNILSLRGPELNAGCGGIDMYFGAFSYIDAQRFIDMMESIGQNAIGYGFQLGLQNLCPQCTSVLKSLQNAMDKMNAMNINSCETAKLLWNGVAGGGGFSHVADKMQQSVHDACKNLSVAWGLVNDRVEASDYCSDEEGVNTVKNSIPDPEQKKDLEITGNLVWQALKTASVDNSFKEIIMSMTGTRIVTKDSSGKVDSTDTPPTITNVKDLIGDPLSPTLSVTVLKCSEYDECLNMSENNSITISSQAYKTLQILQGIKDKVNSKTQLSREEESFINSTQFPVYKMIAEFYTEPTVQDTLIYQIAPTIASYRVRTYMIEAINILVYSDHGLVKGDGEYELSKKIKFAMSQLNQYIKNAKQELDTFNSMLNSMVTNRSRLKQKLALLKTF